MHKTILLIVIISLLATVIGYLALDRDDKHVEQQKTEKFINDFAK